jgi:PD-(D/E)XK endonuclease
LLSVLTTNAKGAIAEAALAKAALEVRYDVYRPMFEGGRYDLILDTGDTLLRVQCKWAPLHSDVVVIRSYSTRRNAEGLVRRPYVQGEFDALGAYCEALERCYLIPYEAISGATQLHLRIAPARNNQHLGVHLASHYEFGATLPQTQLGPIAQLGERRDGIA